MLADIGDSACEVWWARRAQYHPDLAGMLDRIERGRLAGFVRGADKERFVVGCALTRRVLGVHLSVPPSEVPLDRRCARCGKPHGKVRVTMGDPPVQLSVSHSGEHVLLALHRTARVGVDVERIDYERDPLRIARLALTDAEVRRLERLDLRRRAATFTTYWVRMEARVKATGEGLASATFSDDPGTIQVHDLSGRPGYAAALAVVGEQPARIREHEADRLLAPP